MKAFGWLVLAGVFLVEMLAFAAVGVVGARVAGAPGAIVAVVLVVVLWALVASPRARFRGPVVTRLVKLAVFGGAGLGLALTGSWGLGVGLVAVAAVLSGLAQLPGVRGLAAGNMVESRPTAEPDGGGPASR